MLGHQPLESSDSIISINDGSAIKSHTSLLADDDGVRDKIP